MNKNLNPEAEKTLETYFGDIEKLIYQSYEEQGISTSTASGTVRHNTTELKNRVNNIQNAIAGTSSGLCAELGCGYGFLALAIHTELDLDVIGFDRNPQFLKLGNSFLKQHPQFQDKLSFQELDYVINPLPVAKFDLVTLYGTFHYIVGLDNQTLALQNAYNSLKVGGKICIQLPNRWYPIEPFTKLWFVHWLPREIGSKISVQLNRRSLMDIEHHSPLHVIRLLKHVGFKEIHHLSLGKFRRLPKPFSFLLGGSYVISAQK